LYFAPWLTTILIGSYCVLGSYIVTSVGGDVSLGTFLATINIFKDIGAEIEAIYKECMEIQQSLGPLQRITHYMNTETDLHQRKEINRMRRKVGESRRTVLRATVKHVANDGKFAVDSISIKVEDLNFSYSGSGRTPVTLLRNVSCEFDQGSVYAFVGPPRQGKSTFMKLLGQAMLTDSSEGKIFVPPHLRILHLAADATLLNGSLVDNIILNADLAEIGGIQRVRRICERVGLSENLRALIGKEEPTLGSPEETAWHALLSHTDYARLNLIRVFVTNPEVIIMHKPVMSFDDQEQRSVMELLRENVERKGIELPEQDEMYRRPRTIFYTSGTLVSVAASDVVYKVSLKDGVIPVSADSVSEDMLR